MYVRTGVIAFLHGFARFAHASPRSFDWFAQPVGFPSTPNPNPKKGAEQAPGDSGGFPLACAMPKSQFFFSLDQANLSVISPIFSMFLHVFLAVPLNTKNGEEGHPRLFFSFLGGVTQLRKRCH